MAEKGLVEFQLENHWEKNGIIQNNVSNQAQLYMALHYFSF